MAAVVARLRSLSHQSIRHRRMTVVLPLVFSAGLWSCASTQDLYAQYDEQFCPVDSHNAVVSTNDFDSEVVERLVVKEVVREVPAASATMLTWEPAVYYKSDSTKLSRTAKRALDTNVNMLQKFPRYLIAIRGFTDTHSSESYNRQLAQKRIAVVKAYLTKNGISGRRVVGSSHGESIPLAGDQSAIADHINRRVELLLLDRNGRPVASRLPVVLGPSES